MKEVWLSIKRSILFLLSELNWERVEYKKFIILPFPFLSLFFLHSFFIILLHAYLNMNSRSIIFLTYMSEYPLYSSYVRASSYMSKPYTMMDCVGYVGSWFLSSVHKHSNNSHILPIFFKLVFIFINYKRNGGRWSRDVFDLFHFGCFEDFID